MAFWDDMVRNLFGGGQSSTKSKPKSGAVGRGLQRASRDFRPSTTAAPAPQARAAQQSPVTFSSVLSGGGGGGGGRGGFATMSRGNQAPVEKKDPETPEMSPWDMFIYGQSDSGRKRFAEDQSKPESKFNFWDDLGAKLTQPSGGIGDPDFWSPIAGAAQRKEDADNKREDVGLKPGDIPSNEQLRQLGAADDTVNIDGDLVPLNNSPQFNQQLIEQGAAVDAGDARVDLANAFGDRGEVTVRELTTDEWNALTPEQQQGVLSSWALYQASLEDQALADAGAEREEGYDEAVNSIFSAQGGSDIYAPNTVRVLGELGYQNQSADLDNFIDQSALPTYEDILGQSLDNGSSARKDVYSALAGSTAFDNETITSALDRGQNLLDAIRVSGAVSDDFKMFSGVQSDYGDLTEEDFGNLNTLLNNLSNREVFARISSDPELNQRLTDSINEANELYGSDIVSQYFMDSVKTFDNLTDYMSPEEFSQNWLEG